MSDKNPSQSPDSINPTSIVTPLSSQMGRRNFLKVAGVSTATGIAAFSGMACAQNEAEKRWKVGVIGHTGSGDYGHSLDTLWNEIPTTVVTCLADANEKGRTAQQAKFPQAEIFADYKEMLKKHQPDIVVVAPRHIHEHRDMIITAAEAGAKGIYTEKPFCRTPAEADEIVAALEKSGTKLAIAHRNRFSPVVAVVQKAVNEGVIGDLLEIRTRGKEDHRGGALDLWVLASHNLDLALAFTGAPTQCSADLFVGKKLAEKADITDGPEGVGPIVGDRLHARIETESGIPIFVESIKDKGVPTANFGIRLVGNQGMIDLRIDVDPLAHLLAGQPFRPPKKPISWVPISSAGIGKPEPIEGIGKKVAGHYFAAMDLIASIGENRRPLSNELTSRQVVDMTHAIFASHINRGGRVTLPLEDRQHGLSPWL